MTDKLPNHNDRDHTAKSSQNLEVKARQEVVGGDKENNSIISSIETHNSSLPNAGTVKLPQVSIENKEEQSRINSMYSKLKEFPEIVAAGLSKDEIAAVLPLIFQDMQKNPYDPRGKIPGHVEPGSPNSPFTHFSKSQELEPNQEDQRTIDFLALRRNTLKPGKENLSSLIDKKSSNLFDLGHIEPVPASPTVKDIAKAIKNMKLAGASEEQLTEYQKQINFSEIEKKDPLGLSTKYLNAQLTNPEAKLTEAQKQVLAEQKEAQKLLRLAVNLTKKLDHLTKESEEHNWLPDSPFYNKDNAKFLDHINQNLSRASTDDLFRARGTINKEIKTGTIHKDDEILEQKIQTEIVKRFTDEIFDKFGIRVETENIPETKDSIHGQKSDLSALSSYMPMLLEELSLYDKDLFRQSGIEKITLCQNLMQKSEQAGGVADYIHNAIYLDTNNPFYFSRRQAIHHEIFHMIDAKDDGFEDEAWKALNAPDFKYNQPIAHNMGVTKIADFPGFHNHYSMSQVREDKAEVFSHMVAGDIETHWALESNPVLKAKSERMQEILQKFNPMFDKGFFSKAKERFGDGSLVSWDYFKD